MDSQVGAAGILAIESSKVAETETPEPTGLSPLASSLDHNLTIAEDMGIENTWWVLSQFSVIMVPCLWFLGCFDNILQLFYEINDVEDIEHNL